MPDHPTFVLVHGGFHDGSAWSRTQAALAAQGYASVAPTLPGHGPRAHRDVTFNDQVRSVVEAVNSCTGAVVLVAHSYAGCVVQMAAIQASRKIVRLIFHSAVVVPAGSHTLDVIPPEFVKSLDLSLSETPVSSFDTFIAVSMNEADPADARAAWQQLSPNPTAPLRDPIDTTDFFTLNIPTSVVVGTDDISMPAGWRYHPNHSQRLGAFELIELPGNHELLFDDPAGLADAFIAASGVAAEPSR